MQTRQDMIAPMGLEKMLLDSLNYLIASYLIPYVGLTGYVGANEKLESPVSRRLVAGLLGVESGQDAVIRALLYEKATQTVPAYGITVAEFTNKISSLRNKLGHTGLKDEGLIVPKSDGAEGKIAGNVLAGGQKTLQAYMLMSSSSISS
ncbi:hypothetical protein QYF36_005653 [Acer negundo]|nr:hypothetical protein QYF36_005653 [Acer negundo]